MAIGRCAIIRYSDDIVENTSYVEESQIAFFESLMPGYYIIMSETAGPGDTYDSETGQLHASPPTPDEDNGGTVGV